MTHTRDAIVPVLTLLASASGSGLAAYHLIAFLKQRIPSGNGPLATLLHTPRYLRVVALLLAGVIAVLAKISLAAITGEDLLVATDLALAGALSAIVSQLLHGLTLSATTPAQQAAQEQSRILDLLNDTRTGGA
ncbi:hypothetical protein [Kallotenue papyrolyticum]|uniref:hypothetical protein n=1 Tax=Kallotenue papyrolyticum TaxID=1325125 RepID=UPI000478621C|nr:hypothetical protein [Kallotenue papyrolyticum]